MIGIPFGKESHFQILDRLDKVWMPFGEPMKMKLYNFQNNFLLHPGLLSTIVRLFLTIAVETLKAFC